MLCNDLKKSFQVKYKCYISLILKKIFSKYSFFIQFNLVYMNILQKQSYQLKDLGDFEQYFLINVKVLIYVYILNIYFWIRVVIELFFS